MHIDGWREVNWVDEYKIEVKEKNQHLKDLSPREILVFAPLVVWAFWIGLSPQPYFKILERPTAQIVERVHPGYYAERHMRNPIAPSPTAEANSRTFSRPTA